MAPRRADVAVVVLDFVWLCLLGSIAVALVLARAAILPLMCLVFGVGAVRARLATRRLRTMAGRLSALPFPITYKRVKERGRPWPIRFVRIHARRPLDEAESDALIDGAPPVGVRIATEVIELANWPSGTKGAVLFAGVLDSWGREIHRICGIERVDVAFANPNFFDEVFKLPLLLDEWIDGRAAS